MRQPVDRVADHLDVGHGRGDRGADPVDQGARRAASARGLGVHGAQRRPRPRRTGRARPTGGSPAAGRRHRVPLRTASTPDAGRAAPLGALPVSSDQPGGTGARPTDWAASTNSGTPAAAHSRRPPATGCTVPTSWLALDQRPRRDARPGQRGVARRRGRPGRAGRHRHRRRRRAAGRPCRTAECSTARVHERAGPARRPPARPATPRRHRVGAAGGEVSSSGRTPSTSATAARAASSSWRARRAWRVELAGVGPAVVERGQRAPAAQRDAAASRWRRRSRHPPAQRYRDPDTTDPKPGGPRMVEYARQRWSRLAVREHPADGLHGAAKEAGAGGRKRFEPRARRRARRLGRRGDDPARRVLRRRRVRWLRLAEGRHHPAGRPDVSTCGSAPWSPRSSVGVFVWGLIFWCVVRYRKRGDELPPADPVQPADRDPLHGRAVPDHRGAVLLHRGRPDRRQPALHEPGRHRRGRSRSSGTGSSTTATPRARTASRSHRRRRRLHPGAGAADRQADPVQGALAGRHPLVLGAGAAVQAGRHPRQRGATGSRSRSRTTPPAPTSAAAPSCAAPTTR